MAHKDIKRLRQFHAIIGGLAMVILQFLVPLAIIEYSDLARDYRAATVQYNQPRAEWTLVVSIGQILSYLFLIYQYWLPNALESQVLAKSIFYLLMTIYGIAGFALGARLALIYLNLIVDRAYKISTNRSLKDDHNL